MNQYRQLFPNLSDAILIEDSHGVILDANPAAARILRAKPDALVHRPLHALLTPESHARLINDRAKLQPTQCIEMELHFVIGMGVIIATAAEVTRSSWVPDDASNEAGPAYLIVIREKKGAGQSDSDLQMQQQAAAMSYGGLPQAVFTLYAEPRARRIVTGMDDAFADQLQGLISGPLLEAAVEAARAGQTTLLPPAWYRLFTESGARGRPCWLKIACSPARSASAGAVHVQVVDFTSERLEQEAIRRKDQQVFLGLLTSALHHELNNYLAVILAQASGLRLSLAQGQLPPPNVGAIIDATQQAATLLRRSAELMMSNETHATGVNLNAVVADCANVLECEFGTRIILDLEFGPDVPNIRGDESLLKTMVLCLARHAQTSLPPGSRITIGTYRSAIFYPGMPAAAGLSVKDNLAANLSAERSNSKLRSVGSGSTDGYDYSLARSIIRYHRGEVEVINSNVQGNIWEVTLPGLDDRMRPAGLVQGQPSARNTPTHELSRTAADALRANGATDGLATGPRRTAKILLADDEENFRIFTSWVLRENGYEVVSAADGQEAFERFQEAPQSFNLVILDAYMPRLGGMETYLRMQVLRPDLPVLFASGFVRGATVDTMIGSCPGPASVILKPFTSEELLAAVNKALAPKVQPEEVE